MDCGQLRKLAKCKSESGRDLVNTPSEGRSISGGLIAILILCHRLTGLQGTREKHLAVPLAFDKDIP